jgi:hypothetical protein
LGGDEAGLAAIDRVAVAVVVAGLADAPAVGAGDGAFGEGSSGAGVVA